MPLRRLLPLALLRSSAQAYDNGVSKVPPLGWNTWCTCESCPPALLTLCSALTRLRCAADGDCAQPFEPHPDPAHDICVEAEIISVAEAMAANGMKAIGWEYINLDGAHLSLCCRMKRAL